MHNYRKMRVMGCALFANDRAKSVYIVLVGTDYEYQRIRQCENLKLTVGLQFIYEIFIIYVIYF